MDTACPGPQFLSLHNEKTPLSALEQSTGWLGKEAGTLPRSGDGETCMGGQGFPLFHINPTFPLPTNFLGASQPPSPSSSCPGWLGYPSSGHMYY